jgi:hypothetical protein
VQSIKQFHRNAKKALRGCIGPVEQSSPLVEIHYCSIPNSARRIAPHAADIKPRQHRDRDGTQR